MKKLQQKKASAISAYARILSILRPFPDEARRRIVRAVAILLGVTP